jgi:hypothetical protein
MASNTARPVSSFLPEVAADSEGDFAVWPGAADLSDDFSDSPRLHPTKQNVIKNAPAKNDNSRLKPKLFRQITCDMV